jgi:alanine dehydrogenase
VIFLGRADIEDLLDPVELIAELEQAFASLSDGDASAPARIAATAPGGKLLAMPGFVNGVFATKLVTLFPGNHSLGLPTHQALIALFDPDDGTPLAVLDGEHITATRTAVTSALAARLVGRSDARSLAILGAGVQGRAHAEVFRDLLDIICACTHAESPVLRREWLRPGAHVGSVGAGDGHELDDATVAAGLLVVESRVAFCPFPAGARDLEHVDPALGVELGEIISGRHPGRTSPDQITVFKSIGHAIEDAVAAALVFRLATADSRGTPVTL